MRILIAEDDRASARILESRLERWGYEPVIARDGTQALYILQQDNCPRVALLDWMMPGIDGPEVCRRVRKLVPEPYRYIIMLTVKDLKDDLIQGLEAGADDYLSKPVDFQELQVRLRTGVRIVELQRQLTEVRDQLQHQAMHDSLTGIWNRNSVLDALDREISRASREKRPVAVAMLDLDFFKRVNDTHGHPAGDVVLKEMARRIRSSMRDYDSLGRYGGEEFMIVLPGCDEAGARSQAERIRRVVSAEPVQLSDKSITITASLGIALWLPGMQPLAEPIIQASDSALYAAKAAGRNRVETSALPHSSAA